MKTVRTVSITEHALDQWRRRVAEYADAVATEIITAVQEAKPGNPYPGTIRDAGNVYLYHDRHDCVFVCEPTSHCLKVVTVRKPSQEKNHLLPKPKQKHPEPVKIEEYRPVAYKPLTPEEIATSTKNVLAETARVNALLEETEPAGLDEAGQLAWWVARHSALLAQLPFWAKEKLKTLRKEADRKLKELIVPNEKSTTTRPVAEDETPPAAGPQAGPV